MSPWASKTHDDDNDAAQMHRTSPLPGRPEMIAACTRNKYTEKQRSLCRSSVVAHDDTRQYSARLESESESH